MRKFVPCVLMGLLLLGAVPFRSPIRQASCTMACCRLAHPQASCQLRHGPQAFTLAVGSCGDKAPASAPSVPPSLLPSPIGAPVLMASGPAAAALILWPESATPSLFDPPPRA